VLLESHIGAFSVIIGKHFTNIETPNLPFSYIHDDQGVSKIIPGMTLFSVGTVRDGEKWPKRDTRKAPQKRDLIIFDVFSPYSVEKMRKGRSELLALSESTPKEKSFILYGGLQLNRLLLRKGAKYYSMAISRYLNEKVCTRIYEQLLLSHDWNSIRTSLLPSSHLEHASEWTDICGLLTPSERMKALEENVASGAITNYRGIIDALQAMYGSYRQDEWQYVVEAFEQEYGQRLETFTREQALAALDEWQKSAVSLHAMILEDSKREFGAFARIGYGIGQTNDLREIDFTAVRGSSDTNAVVQKLVREGEALQQRYEQLKNSFKTS
jgi:hypothetical protein